MEDETPANEGLGITDTANAEGRQEAMAVGHGDNASANYDVGLGSATARTPASDTRSDAEVMADARHASSFPTLLEAFPTTPEGPRRPTSAKERRAAKRAFRHDLKDARRKTKAAGREHRQATKAERQRYKSISRQLKERDRELSQGSQQQRKARRAAKSVYAAIGFDRMFRSGICEVEQGLWSETVEFSDVSYQSAVEESQKATFNALAQLLDWFGADTMVQYSVANTPIPEEEVGHRTFFDPATAGENAALADQFNGILNQKMLDGCSNMRRTRHITYATAAPDPETAERALSRMRAQVRQQMQKCRSQTHLLDGTERLALASTILRPGKPFSFDYARDLSARSPLTAKDFVCPTSLDFRPDGGDATCFMSEDVWCQVLVVRPTLASEITDRAISDILDLPIPMVFTWHLQPIDKAKSVAMIKHQAAWIQKEVIDNQRRALSCRTAHC